MKKRLSGLLIILVLGLFVSGAMAANMPEDHTDNVLIGAVDEISGAIAIDVVLFALTAEWPDKCASGVAGIVSPVQVNGKGSSVIFITSFGFARDYLPDIGG